MIWLLLLIPAGVVLYFILRKKKTGNIAVKSEMTFKKYTNG